MHLPEFCTQLQRTGISSESMSYILKYYETVENEYFVLPE
jgi:hypothetical protein